MMLLALVAVILIIAVMAFTSKCVYGQMRPSVVSLQTLVDAADELTLDRNYTVNDSLIISKNITIRGNGYTVALSKSAGTVPVILISERAPGDFCQVTSDDWGTQWKGGSWDSGIIISGLTVIGNSQGDDIPYLGDKAFRLRRQACECETLDGRRSKELREVCGFYRNKEASTSFDAFSMLKVIDEPPGCSDSFLPCSDTSCQVKPTAVCKPTFATNYDIMVNASAITVVNASNVLLDSVNASYGRSAGISCFFGCSGITLHKCHCSNNVFDGFGPDMLRDAIITECTFETSHAGVSVSAGALPQKPGASGWIPPSGWFGEIVMSGCTTKGGLSLYANSPNRYVLDKEKDSGQANIADVKPLLGAPDAEGAAPGMLTVIPAIPVKDRHKYTGGCLRPGVNSTIITIPRRSCPTARLPLGYR